MRCLVRTTSRTDREISRITQWYRQRSGSAEVAKRWIEGLRAAMQGLAVNPQRHNMAREADDLGEEIREVHYGSGRKKSHRILFRILDSERVVEVIGVRHFAQRDLTSDDL